MATLWPICLALITSLPGAVRMASDECHFETYNTAEERQDVESRQIHHTVAPSESTPLDPKHTLFTTKNVHVKSNAPVQILETQPDDPTVIDTNILPQSINYMPEVGNGQVATAIHSDAIFMNGLYNGASITSHRARIPSTVSYLLHGYPPVFNTSYSLNMGKGYFVESHKGDGVSITLTTFAHRVWSGVLVSLLTMSRDDVDKRVDVFVHLDQGEPSEDIDFYHEDGGVIRGQTKVAEYPELATRTTFYMKTSASLSGRHVMDLGETTHTIAAFTVIDVDKQKVLDDYSEAEKAFANGTLLSSHVKEWETIWNKGRIDVEGNLTLSRINYAATYYLLSSLPFNGNRKDWPFIGLSPGGLAHGDKDKDYMGHVFWDQDIWMSPGLSLLHADIAKLLVETRTKTLDAAKLLSKRTGFQGARYPWESAFTGLETCPGNIWSDLEIHITGDVSLMMRQYWHLTKDKSMFLDGKAFDVVTATAEFFASRVVYDEANDYYRILDVMPPDEWHHPVNDSVYTNAIARRTLNFANQMARELGKPENATWTEIANKLRILYDSKQDYNPEYDGYTVGEYTKQADVVLLPYPLMVPIKNSTMENNLEFYEKSTPVGPAPAMTWSMFLLNWLALGNETRAAEQFERSILNAQEPFYIWTENSDGSGATNFLTGMGGHLQSLLFGYGGIRLYDDHMAFNPKMIPSTTSATFTGIDYMGSSFDLRYTENDIHLNLISIGQISRGLEVKFSSLSTWQRLDLTAAVIAKREPFKIREYQS